MEELGSIGKNTAWQLFGKGIGTIISMATIFFIIRLLGPVNYGTFALLTTIMNFFYLIGGLGFEGSIVYFLSKYKNSQQDFLKKFLKARIILIAISIIILLFSVDYISKYYNNPALKNYLPLIALSLPFFILMNNALVILQGLNSLKFASISDLIFNIVKIIAIPLIIFLGLAGGMLGYAIAYVVCTIYTFKKIAELSVNKNKIFDKYKEFAKFSIVNFLIIISSFIAINLLPLILGKNPLELGYLDSSMRVGALIQLIPTALLTALMPSIIGKSNDDIKKVSSKIMNYILIYSIPLLAFFLFASNFATEFLLGSEFKSIYVIIQISSITYALNNLIGFFEAISYSIGKNKNNLINNVIKMVIIIALSSYAITAFNTSLIILLSSIIICLFISIKIRKYYSIDFKSAAKIIASALPLIIFFAFDMNLILKILGSVVSSIIYLFLIWKKVLDDIDRELFARFAAKIKGIIFKK